MAERLSILTRMYVSNAAAFRQHCRTPLLVWMGAPAPGGEGEDVLWITRSIDRNAVMVADPLVFSLEKRIRKANPFGLGVTVGRTPNNDIEVREPSVSRFHAYFKQSERGESWEVVDVESFNGTFLRGERLKSRQPIQLDDHALIRFGAAEMQLFLPSTFEDYVRRRSKGAA